MPEEVFETPQPIQPITEPKPTNWPKIILAAVLGFVLLAGSAYAGYYYGTQQVQQPEKPTPVASQPTPKPTPTPEPTAPPAVDPTANWKTIQIGTNVNPQRKLEIKYPPNWFYLSGKELGGTGAGDFITSFYTNKIVEDLSEEEIQIQIFILLPPEEGLDNFSLNYEKSGLISPVKIKINNFEGYEGETDTGIKYLLKIDENNIAQIYVSPTNSKLIETFNQILSTFKFLD